MIELDSTITKVNNINELGKIDIGKDDTQSTKDIKDDIPIEEGYQKFIKIENKIIINKTKSNIATYHPKGTVKENKTYDLITPELYYQDEISLRKAYKDWKKRINKRQIDNNTDKVEKMNMKTHRNGTHDKIIECYSKININKGPDIINNLEYTGEMWKKRIETLKGVTKKFKEADPNELKKQEEYKPNNLNHSCTT
ncbi:hypothetical protein F8M41_003065 [Gigaspora margarita]|uniref:Uncharacterized protein n=1 Tax=Gigaspora margarita TaxID=4874 RepID=A0A8H4A7Z5_GIGMA|nr:hypothetical protein F8M41_003065 [Gigaspora margarita]